MGKLRLGVAICLFVLGAVLCGISQAQTVTGTITGTVLDPSNQLIIGASVTLTNQGTGGAMSALTGQTGAFVFTAVPPGEYSVSIESAGFKKVERKGLVLTAAERLALGDIAMSVGSVAETITVEAQGAAVQTGSAENSALLTSDQIASIQTRGRDIVGLLKLLPGVQNTADVDAPGAAGYGTSMPNIGGNRAFYNTVGVDGLVGNDMGWPLVMSSTINMDAIGEVKVLLNNYQAEYAGNGGTTMSIVSKSGTRDFHGGGYWYKRHEMFNGNNYFNNLNNVPKPRYRYNTLGASVGGPVVIPGIDTGKDKLFFFYSIEDWLTKVPQGLRQYTMPTALERAGDFSQTVDLNNKQIAIKDPTTGQQFPGNVIPKTGVNANGLALLNVFPQPNFTNRALTGGNYNFVFQESLKNPRWSQVIRLDYQPTGKDRISVRPMLWYSDQEGYAIPAGASNWGQFDQHYRFTDNGLSASYTRTISPTVVNEFTGGARHSVEKWIAGSDAELQKMLRSSVGFNVGQLYPSFNPLGVLPIASFGGVTNAPPIAYDGRFLTGGADTVFNGNCSGPYFSLDKCCEPCHADLWRCRASTQNE